ncbi:head-tail adaptor protein [Roseobacter sp. GAI101]|uniref:head-tail adaptor protein n=1 Tax=Roseobacter sp. (strain GAI101) TaxID=391589 RepID=UPI0002FCE45E|nr:head-tail adaptor protein [Roseobacter sp. GAI101]
MTVLQLNRRLVLEAPTRLVDGAGGYRETWVALGTVWADVQARGGREAAQASVPISRMGFAITVRAAPFGSPERPEPQQRFREGTRVFKIQTVSEQDQDARYLVCLAQEEVVV